ncbi:SUPT20H family protein [Megaselia abdita]
MDTENADFDNTSRRSRVSDEEPLDLNSKIKELYLYLLLNDRQKSGRQRHRSFILEHLVATENIHRIVINLFPGNKGYSLCYYSDSETGSGPSTSQQNGLDNHYHHFQSQQNQHQHHHHHQKHLQNNKHLVELFHWPYEVDELLYYLDNCQIPTFIADILDERVPNVYYSGGCVICEVRDYRQNFLLSSNSCDTSFVLLRPTNEEFFAAVHHYQELNQTDEAQTNKYESQLVLAAAEPLCLDPDPEIGRMAINSKFMRESFNTRKMKLRMRKFSQVAINRKRKIDQFTNNPNTGLCDYIQRLRQLHQRTDNKNLLRQNFITLSQPAKPTSYGVTAPPNLLNFPDLTPPESCDVQAYATSKSNELPGKFPNFIPILIEEYTLETDSHREGCGRIYHIKLSISQRPADLEFLGELYVDRDYRPDQRNGESCHFVLGSRNNVNKYIKQFTEIFTEEGRKAVKITLWVPGQTPVDVSKQYGVQPQQHVQGQQQQQLLLPQLQQIQRQEISSPPQIQRQTSIVNNRDMRPTIMPIVMHQPQQVQRPAQAQIVLHHQPHVHQTQPQQSQVTSNNIGIIKTQQVPATIIGRNIIIPQQQQPQTQQQQQQQQQQTQQQSNQQKISNAAIINLLNSAPAAMTTNTLINRSTGNITPQSQPNQPTSQQVVQQLSAAVAAAVAANTSNVDASQQQQQQSISNSNQSPNLLSLLQSPQIQIANARVISNNENNGNDTLTKILTIAASGGNRTFIQGKVPTGIQTLQNMHIQIAPGMTTPIQVTVTENGKVQQIPQTTQVNKMQMVPGSSHIAIQKNAINSTNLQAGRGRNILVSTGRGITPTILTQRNIAGTIRTGGNPMQTQVHSLLTGDSSSSSSGNVIHLIRNPNQVVIQTTQNQHQSQPHQQQLTAQHLPNNNP